MIQSPRGDLLVTAAHCVTGTTGAIAFVPGYANGNAPYGIWPVTRVFTDQAWDASAGQDHDVAFLEVSDNGTSTRSRTRPARSSSASASRRCS